MWFCGDLCPFSVVYLTVLFCCMPKDLEQDSVREIIELAISKKIETVELDVTGLYAMLWDQKVESLNPDLLSFT